MRLSGWSCNSSCMEDQSHQQWYSLSMSRGPIREDGPFQQETMWWDCINLWTGPACWHWDRLHPRVLCGGSYAWGWWGPAGECDCCQKAGRGLSAHLRPGVHHRETRPHNWWARRLQSPGVWPGAAFFLPPVEPNLTIRLVMRVSFLVVHWGCLTLEKLNLVEGFLSGSITTKHVCKKPLLIIQAPRSNISHPGCSYCGSPRHARWLFL